MFYTVRLLFLFEFHISLSHLGILIVVAIGVALGIFFGGLLLSVVVVYMRRFVFVLILVLTCYHKISRKSLYIKIELAMLLIQYSATILLWNGVKIILIS